MALAGAPELYFANRCVAGRQLAAELSEYQARPAVVLAVVPGGVPVGYEVAHVLEAPLHAMVAQVLRAPGSLKRAIGAVAPASVYYDDDAIRSLDVRSDDLSEEVDRGVAVVAKLAERYRAVGYASTVRGKTALVVADGIGVAAPIIAAVQSAREWDAHRVVVATPVCFKGAADMLRDEADDVVCLEAPEQFGVVGMWYADFSPVGDEEIFGLLKRARLEREADYHGPTSSSKAVPCDDA